MHIFLTGFLDTKDDDSMYVREAQTPKEAERLEDHQILKAEILITRKNKLVSQVNLHITRHTITNPMRFKENSTTIHS